VIVDPNRGFTQKQGQYLAFIYYFTKIHRIPPAEADFQKFFKVSPPAVYEMILALERRGFIERTVGMARSIRLRVARARFAGSDWQNPRPSHQRLGFAPKNPGRMKRPRRHLNPLPPAPPYTAYATENAGESWISRVRARVIARPETTRNGPQRPKRFRVCESAC
jgi:hypothetical protein